MTDPSKNAAPRPQSAADWESIMSALGKGNALPECADDPRMEEILTRWDELPGDLLTQVADHAAHGPRLRHLRKVESYLAGSVCPESEDLYDFARGPGYTPLATSRRQEIEDHLIHCGDCEGLVESLESNPPLPLEWDEETPHPAASTSTSSLVRPPRPIERWLPLTAAAAVLAIGLLVFRSSTVDAGDRWPTYPLMRGPSADALVFPRDRVLVQGAVPGGGWNARPLFELTEVPGATEYRVVVRSHGGGAFGEGRTILDLTDADTTLLSAESLPEGHYTWEAWAEIDGLDKLLGERDFEVHDAHELEAELLRHSDLERVHTLHAEGLWTDARALARRMPSSVGRDAYLGEKPGR